jgi:hypothetical protein
LLVLGRFIYKLRILAINKVEKKFPYLIFLPNEKNEFEVVSYKVDPTKIDGQGSLAKSNLEDLFLSDEELENKIVGQYEAEVSFRLLDTAPLVKKSGESWHGIFCKEFNKAVKKLDKNHWRELKEIRLEALQKSPDSFLASFEEESQR